MIACLCHGRSVLDAKHASKTLLRELDGVQRVCALSLRKTSSPISRLGLTWKASMAHNFITHCFFTHDCSRFDSLYVNPGRLLHIIVKSFFFFFFLFSLQFKSGRLSTSLCVQLPCTLCHQEQIHLPFLSVQPVQCLAVSPCMISASWLGPERTYTLRYTLRYKINLK